MATIPQILIHEVVLGGTFTGVVPATGLPTNKVDVERGRIVKYVDQASAGLVVAPPIIGYKFVEFAFKGPATTAAKLYLVDMDGFEYLIHSETTSPADFFVTFRNGVMVAPGWKVKFVSTTALTAKGRAIFFMGPGWVPMQFHDIPYMGE